MGELKHFLLFFSPVSRALEVVEFDDASEANRAFAEAEARHADDDHIQVVLLSAASTDVLKKTHPHYFTDANASDEYALI